MPSIPKQEAAQSHEGQQSGQEMPEAEFFHGQPWQPTAMWGIAFFAMFLLAAFGMTRLKKVPGALQGAWEFTYEWVEGIVMQVMGPKGMDYFPLFLCYFLYILFNNLTGLIPGLASATSKLDTTVALALTTFLSTHVLGLKKKGLGYIKHFFSILDYREAKGAFPMAVTVILQFILLPLIEIIGEFARPLSLSMRLFGNIFAKETILAVLASMTLDYWMQSGLASKAVMLMPLVLRPAVLILGVLVSIIQAVVFTALSMVYISGAIAMHEGHDDASEPHPASAH
jgi:F-type H+-transporting ATPase subunit a